MKCRKIPKGKRDMKKDQGLPGLSAREISQRGKEALEWAIRITEIFGSQPHKCPGDRVEQMNRVDRNTGIHMLKRTETFTRLWNDANPHLSRATTEQLHLTLKAIIRRLPAPDASAVASMKSNAGLWTRNKHYEDFIQLDKALFSPCLPVLYIYFFIGIKSKTLK